MNTITQTYIDELIEGLNFWEKYKKYYLEELIPGFVVDISTGTSSEQTILKKIKTELTANEWRNLPKLVLLRLSGEWQETEKEANERNWKKAMEDQRAREERIRREQEEMRARLKKQYEEKEREERHRKEKEAREKEAQKQSIFKMLHACFQDNFMDCEVFFRDKCASHITFDEFAAARCDFVRQWFVNNIQTVDGKKQHLPDDEQLEAIAAQDKQIHVVARAGSGKTSTTINRALFLVKHCNIPAGSLLLLTFNRKAALEVRKRLLIGLLRKDTSFYNQRKKTALARKSIYKVDPIQLEENLINKIAMECDLSLPHVMTFHALAHAIVHPEEELLFDGEDGEPQKLSRAIQDILDSHLRSPETFNQVRELMLAHFKSDWERIISGGYDKSREELLAFRRSLTRESLGGDFVKSYGEKLIANFLFEHEIPYKYEKHHWWNGFNYRPDFTIFVAEGKDIVIEYFGLQGDPDYDQMSQEKRRYWSKHSKYTFIEFSRTDVTRGGEGDFCEVLKNNLERCGVTCVRLSEDVIWEKVKDRSIDSFTKAVVNFVGRCRQQNLSPGALQRHIGNYEPLNQVESRFLHLASRIFTDYMDRLEAVGEEDFNGLMLRASAEVASGHTRFNRKNGAGDIRSLSHVFVDEFQDFSKLFFNLIQSIRSQNFAARLFCVGDDWQAINGFAGSELRYFHEFQKYLGKHRRMYIATNYRSSRTIVELGNAVMHGGGEPARANKEDLGRALLCDIDSFAPSNIEEQFYPGDLLTPAVLRLLDKSLQKKGGVVLLSRTNTIPWDISYPKGRSLQGKGLDRYLFYLRSFLPEELHSRVSISTTHKYKGLERATVILLDVVARSYPLIHPNSIFTRIFGDSPIKLVQEDRRLLYVAMTRAIHTLYILTNRKQPSPFLEDLATRFQLPEVDWRQYPPMAMEDKLLLVAVGNQRGRSDAPNYSIKDELKASGYTWRAKDNCWIRSLHAKSFSLEALESEIWARKGDGLEVRILDEQGACSDCYHVNGGRWTRLDAVSHPKI